MSSDDGSETEEIWCKHQFDTIVKLGEQEYVNSISLACKFLLSVPKEIETFTNLLHLDLTYTNIRDLPDCLGKLTSLQVLIGRGNLLSQFPPCIFKLTDLRHLNLSNNKIKQVPIKISEFQELKTLILGNNLINSLPQEFADLVSLKQLDLKHNKLTHYPDALYNLFSIESMTLEGNQITYIDNNINQLSTLNSLCLDGNPLRSLPNFVGIKLIDLSIHNTKIFRFPQYLFELDIHRLDFGPMPIFRENGTYDIIDRFSSDAESISSYIESIQEIAKWDAPIHKGAAISTKRNVAIVHILALRDPTTNAAKFPETQFHILPRDILIEICRYFPFYDPDDYFEPHDGQISEDEED